MTHMFPVVPFDPANPPPPAAQPDVPAGWRRIHRYAIVRLGTADGESTGPTLHYNGSHAAVGIVSVGWQADRTLRVVTDYASSREVVLSATANVDAQLAEKGIVAGASGGGATTYYTITSSQKLGAYAPGDRLGPTSSVFNVLTDNLWIEHVSLRWEGEGPMPT